MTVGSTGPAKAPSAAYAAEGPKPVHSSRLAGLRGTLVPVVLALVAGWVLWSSRNPRETFGPSSSEIISAGAVPVALFSVLGLLCLVQLGASFVRGPLTDASTTVRQGSGWKRVAAFWLWFASCVVLTRAAVSFDLTLSVVAFTTAWAFFSGARRPLALVAVALISAVIVNVLVYFTNSPVASLW